MTPQATRDERGFSLVECLAAILFVAVALLAFAQAFTTAYLNVTREGRNTMALTSARQVLEDAKILSIDALDDLNGFDTDSIGSLPADQPARDIARRLRYSVAGSGGGWSYSDTEQARWSQVKSDHGSPGGRATIDVAAQSATLSQVTVTVWMPGQNRPVVLTTLVGPL